MPSSNHMQSKEETAAALLSDIEQVLPSQVQTPEKDAFLRSATQEIQQVLTKLSARTPRFRSSGICRLGMQHDGQEETVLLPIRSVPFDTTVKLIEEAYVEPPRTKKMNIETMEFEMVKDEWAPDYQRKLQQANTHFLKRYTLHALDCELEDEQGTVVWDPKTGVYREAEALRVLDLQGFTQTHYFQIRDEAEQLSMTEQQRQEAMRLKKR